MKIYNKNSISNFVLGILILLGFIDYYPLSTIDKYDQPISSKINHTSKQVLSKLDSQDNIANINKNNLFEKVVKYGQILKPKRPFLANYQIDFIYFSSMI